ncbi:MAG: hypothetical protein M4579_001675 [Chaenotheca gracillima]|nr:MAG: hypothetical protein M4579_001675 [Chaenotheca gracillima]
MSSGKKPDRGNKKGTSGGQKDLVSNPGKRVASSTPEESLTREKRTASTSGQTAGQPIEVSSSDSSDPQDADSIRRARAGKAPATERKSSSAHKEPKPKTALEASVNDEMMAVMGAAFVKFEKHEDITKALKEQLGKTMPRKDVGAVQGYVLAKWDPSGSQTREINKERPMEGWVNEKFSEDAWRDFCVHPRMIKAVESFLELNPAINIDDLGPEMLAKHLTNSKPKPVNKYCDKARIAKHLPDIKAAVRNARAFQSNQEGNTRPRGGASKGPERQGSKASERQGSKAPERRGSKAPDHVDFGEFVNEDAYASEGEEELPERPSRK